MNQDFDTFWDRYPRRVGKLSAIKAYQKALIVATSDEILAGVELYRRHLPDEPRFIAHAATWLNAGRWMDDYTPLEVEKKKTAAYTAYVPLKFRKEA